MLNNQNSKMNDAISKYFLHALDENECARLGDQLKEDHVLLNEFAEQAMLEYSLLCVCAIAKNSPPLADDINRRKAAWRKRFAIVTMAVAASLAAIINGWLYFRYPSPTISGQVRVEGRMHRGCAFVTGNDGGEVRIGGYCTILLEPYSRIAWSGEPYAEAVYLETGGAVFEIRENMGSLVVATDIGRVSAQGNRFRIVVDKEGEDDMQLRKMLVQVMAGAVIITGGWGSTNIASGQEKVVVKSEDPPKERVSEKNGKKNVIAEGVVFGTILSKTDATVKAKSVSGKEAVYTIRFDPDGHPDANAVKSLSLVKIGDHVSIKWYVDSQLRIRKIQVLKKGSLTLGHPDDKGSDKDENTSEPAQTSDSGSYAFGKSKNKGSVTGMVVKKTDATVKVKFTSGKEAVYAVGLDENGRPEGKALTSLSAVKIGDKVSVKWYVVNQQMRFEKIEVLDGKKTDGKHKQLSAKEKNEKERGLPPPEPGIDSWDDR